jgi:hypothetical protein
MRDIRQENIYMREGEEMKTFEDRMRPYYAEAFAILCERQRRYGPKNILEAGTWGVIEQLANKVERARAQIRGEIVDGKVVIDHLGDHREAVLRDSLLDLVNYAAIVLALRDGVWTAEMKTEAADDEA